MTATNRSIATSLLIILALLSQSVFAVAVTCMEHGNTSSTTSQHEMTPSSDSCHASEPATCTQPTQHDCCDTEGPCPMGGMTMSSFIPAQAALWFEHQHNNFVDSYTNNFSSVTSPSLFRPPIV